MSKNKSKKKIIISVVIVLLVVGRILLPHFVLKHLNNYLAEFSPVYKLHIGDLDIALFRTAYRLESVEGLIKKDGEKFLTIDSVDISLAWRELFKGRIVTDVTIQEGNILLTNALFESREFKSEEERRKTAEEASGVKEKVLPLSIEQVTIHESTIQFADTLKLPLTERLVADSIEGSIINLTPNPERPNTMMTAKATILGSSTLKIVGELKMLNKPLDWDIDTEIRKYNLATANKFITRLIPLTFKKGNMDLYVEAKSENGKIKGYAKPFFQDVDVIGDNKDFSNIKHFFVEIITALANAILKDRKTNTVATQINFDSSSGKLVIDDTSEILGKAWDHGAGSPLKPTIDNNIKLKDRKEKK